MRQIRTLVLVALAGLPGMASAEDAPVAAAAPASPHTITTNVNLVSEYRFRGIDQTWGQPALQGGVDYAHADGWYAGLWGSNVSGNSYPGGSLELDYYAGYNGKISDDLGWTAGGYGYYYPGANFNKINATSALTGPIVDQKFDNFEVNAGLSWKWVSYKLSISTTDYFGANTKTGYTTGSKGTLYHDLSVNYPLMDDLTLGFHVGRTDVKAMYGAVNPDYTDYKLSVAKTFASGWNASVAYVSASNNTFFRPPVGGLSATNSDTRELNKGVVVLQAGRTF
ncbi:MAG: TorF family putative porin [Betaproteobacteria bacterium]|nr:TorF family putative porin [Betaproteobacteria bacterium]